MGCFLQEDQVISTEFLIASFVVVVVPGTGVIYTVSTGIFLGGRESVAAAFGCTLGIIPHLLAAVLGLSAIIHMSALAFQVMKLAGAAYLLYLAWAMWRETGAIRFQRSERTESMVRIIVRGVLINILNPKLSIFFLAFLPLFISQESGTPVLQLLMLSSVFMLMTLAVFIVYGISANGVRSRIVESPQIIRWMQRSFAAVFAALGMKLAISDWQG